MRTRCAKRGQNPEFKRVLQQLAERSLTVTGKVTLWAALVISARWLIGYANWPVTRDLSAVQAAAVKNQLVVLGIIVALATLIIMISGESRGDAFSARVGLEVVSRPFLVSQSAAGLRNPADNDRTAHSGFEHYIGALAAFHVGQPPVARQALAGNAVGKVHERVHAFLLAFGES